MSDFLTNYMTRWKIQADAIHKIFCEFGQKIHDVDGNWSHTSDDQSKSLEKKKLLEERSFALKAQRDAYNVQEDLINAASI